MGFIFLKILHWLSGKLVLLGIVLSLLLVAAWVKSELNRLEVQKASISASERSVELIGTELNHLKERRDGLLDRMSTVMEELEALQTRVEISGKVVDIARNNLQRIAEQEKWYFSRRINIIYYAQLDAARRGYDQALATRKLVSALYGTRLNDSQRSAEGIEISKLEQSITDLESDQELLQASLEHQRYETERHPLERMRSKSRELLPIALGVVLGVVLIPPLIKVGLYFGLAPLISKAGAVRLIPECHGAMEVSASSVSKVVRLNPGDELVVNSNYLQAAGVGTGKRTRLLFSWRLPFTSLAAGLYLMVSVSNRDEDPCSVTISPKEDLFEKLVAVEIPQQSALVVYPRSLVGLVLLNGELPHISRHWRIFNLHSLLTFQFRYLVLHGPGTVLLKGCRGVRADPVLAGKPRMQDQCATLGFSANLSYSGTRCETFVDYLLGKDRLFNDKFAGDTGIHLTEETPDPRRKRGMFNRGLEGLLDGVLKAFGI